MKIVNLKDFLKLPSGTLYHEYEPCITGPLTKKHDTLSDKDWIEETLSGMPENHSSTELFDMLDLMLTTGVSFPLETHGTQRNGLYRDNCLFMIYEPDDVTALIGMLKNNSI